MGDDSFFKLANSYFEGPVRVHKELKRFRLISASTGFLLVVRRTLERSCDSFYHFVLHLAATASVFPNVVWKRCKNHKRLLYVVCLYLHIGSLVMCLIVSIVLRNKIGKLSSILIKQKVI